jgi:predicted GNAT superfamily acetyltransferase
MIQNDEIEIRSLHNTKELNEVKRLESKIWGTDDSIPVHQTITAVKHGGLVLGAFYKDTLVGFQYSFPGFDGKSVYLCSHVLATDKAYRNLGIGEKLKAAQRNEARKLGYSMITWTYDPLESINGYLNIGKLGSVCSSYIENCYGEMEDLLNKGIPSDRFQVHWHIDRDYRIDTRGETVELEPALENSLIKWKNLKDGFPAPAKLYSMPEPTSTRAFIAIPKNYREIRETDMETAMEWRMVTRKVFTELFQLGWQVTGFKKADKKEIPVHLYILTKDSSAIGRGDLSFEN